MSLFDAIRDYFHRPAAKTLDVRGRHMHQVNCRQESPRGNFVFPGTDYLDDIEVDGQRIGHVDYGINPLGDRLYINMIEVVLGSSGRASA